MKYKLEKIAMEKSYSPVSVGSITRGTLIVGNKGDIVNKDIEHIVEGSVVIVGNSMYDVIKTSPIVEILQKTADMVLFKTQTSTYMLEKIND